MILFIISYTDIRLNYPELRESLRQISLRYVIQSLSCEGLLLCLLLQIQLEMNLSPPVIVIEPRVGKLTPQSVNILICELIRGKIVLHYIGRLDPKELGRGRSQLL